MPFLFLLGALICNATGNILLKLGAMRGLSLASLSPISLISANWELVLGTTLFGFNLVLYVIALRSLSLSIAYPVMIAVSFIIVNGYAFFGLKEAITPLEIGGYACIVLGLVLVLTRVS